MSEEKTEKDAGYAGYGKPPKEHQFQPGRSGNPGGRPKKRASLLEDLRDELDSALPDGTSAQRKLVNKMVSDALSGNVKAAQVVVSLARSIGAANDDEAGEYDREWIAEFVRSQIKGSAGK